jgi:hypothetical protein
MASLSISLASLNRCYRLNGAFLFHMGTASEPKPLESQRDAARRFLSGHLLNFQKRDRIPSRLRRQVSYPTRLTARRTYII